jgi:hypothetical protein
MRLALVVGAAAFLFLTGCGPTRVGDGVAYSSWNLRASPQPWAAKAWDRLIVLPETDVSAIATYRYELTGLPRDWYKIAVVFTGEELAEWVEGEGLMVRLIDSRAPDVPLIESKPKPQQAWEERNPALGIPPGTHHRTHRSDFVHIGGSNSYVLALEVVVPYHADARVYPILYSKRAYFGEVETNRGLAPRKPR